MKKILAWIAGIVFTVLCICFWLYEKELISGGSLIFVALGVGSIYAIWIDSFWKKISSDDSTDAHFKELIKMLIRHRKDEGTKRVILQKISSEEMSSTLKRNYIWAIDDLIKGDKGKHHLFGVVRAICNLTRDYSVKRFEDNVKAIMKKNALHTTNEEFIDLFNKKMMQCFYEVGGYPTWGDIRKALLPIFEDISKDDAEKFLLKVEERFTSHPNPASNYLQAEEARGQLFISLRRWLIERGPIPA